MMAQEYNAFGFKTLYTDSGIIFENKLTKQLLNATDVLDSIYSPKHRDTSYTNSEYQQDWKSFISLCLTATVSYKFYCTKIASEEDFVPNLPFTFMSYDEAINHIGCYFAVFQLPEIWIEVLMEAYSYIESREMATINLNSGSIPRPMWLAKFLNLSGFAYFALQCALACKLDVGFERVFKLLQGNENNSVPTLGIIQTLYSLAFPDKEAEWLFDMSSTENSLLFNPVSEFDLKRPLTLRPYAFAYIVGGFYISRELASYITEFPNKNEEPLHIGKQLQAVRNSFKAMTTRKEPHF